MPRTIHTYQWSQQLGHEEVFIYGILVLLDSWSSSRSSRWRNSTRICHSSTPNENSCSRRTAQSSTRTLSIRPSCTPSMIYCSWRALIRLSGIHSWITRPSVGIRGPTASTHLGSKWSASVIPYNSSWKVRTRSPNYWMVYPTWSRIWLWLGRRNSLLIQISWFM